MNAERCSRLDELARELELDARVAPFEALRYRAASDPGARSLEIHLDDLSALPLLDGIRGIEFYQHRARVRSSDGDIFLAVTNAAAGYEEYCRSKLHLGAPELVVADAGTQPLEVARAATKGQAWSRIVARAAEVPRVVVHPYMAHEGIWDFADRLRHDADTDVCVLGPPAAVTWLANDKRYFSEVVERTLGADSIAETRVEKSATALAGALLDLAKRHRRVALKRTRSVSGMGNTVFDSQAILSAGAVEVLDRVARFLDRTRGHGDDTVLAVAWETASASPSSQLWIPPPEEGPPRLDGIFEQILDDDGVFIGSRPSMLPPSTHRRITYTALAVAESLQYLGYVGRCSFDHVVVDEGAGDPRVLFVDCNGRWGGTSVPMSIVDRLAGRSNPDVTYRAQDFIDPKLVGVPFTDVLAAMGEQLFDPITGRGRYVLYNVEPLATSGKMDVIAFGPNRAAADAALLEDLPRLLGI